MPEYLNNNIERILMKKFPMKKILMKKIKYRIHLFLYLKYYERV